MAVYSFIRFMYDDWKRSAKKMTNETIQIWI